MDAVDAVACAQQTCSRGGNTFNYKPADSYCEVLNCDPPTNLRIRQGYGHWFVFTNIPGMYTAAPFHDWFLYDLAMNK